MGQKAKLILVAVIAVCAAAVALNWSAMPFKPASDAAVLTRCSTLEDFSAENLKSFQEAVDPVYVGDAGGGACLIKWRYKSANLSQCGNVSVYYSIGTKPVYDTLRCEMDSYAGQCRYVCTVIAYWMKGYLEQVL